MPLFWSKKPKAEKIYDKSGTQIRDAKDSKPATKKTTKKSVTKSTEKTVSITPVGVVNASLYSKTVSIIRPRVTEKSGILSQAGVYTFEIARGANKNTVREAVKALYKVSPIKVSIINVSARNTLVKGRKGVVSGFRKAMVTLRKGEKIDFV